MHTEVVEWRTFYFKGVFVTPELVIPGGIVIPEYIALGPIVPE